MKAPLVKLVAGAFTAVQVAGCGVILYPERVDQPRTGRIDPTVVVLDAVGCLLFLIPGLVAFAVDFHEGTIYLPPGEGAASEWRPVAVAEGPLTVEKIEQAIRDETGQQVSLNDPRLETWPVEDPEHLPVAGMP